MLETVFTAPSTGSYRFALASDDSSRLFASFHGEGLPLNLTQIAQLNGWTSFRNYTALSASYNLIAGQKVSLCALIKEVGGFETLSKSSLFSPCDLLTT